MDSSFYTSVLPPSGLRVLAVFKNGMKSAPTHSFYGSNEDLEAAAATFDAAGKNVFHGCASYSTADNRKGDNVQAIKSLWVDLDVGESKPYATQKEAVAHFEQFRIATGLPKSHVVSSGTGVHQYFALDKPITPAQWDRLASLFGSCLDHFGVKHDTSRTQDKASILRVPGTHNYKTSPPKKVVLKRFGEERSAAAIYKILQAYADANGVIAGTKAPKGTPKVTNDLIGVKDYPPSVGANIVKHCAVLAEVESSGGDVGYETWWRAMGVAKHTTEPEAVAIHWTRNRAATGHEKADAAGTAAAWTAGPTTCAEFAKHSPKCATCKHNGNVKSPIQLGVDEQPVIEPLPEVMTPIGLPTMPGVWTFGAQWIMDAVGKATKTGNANGKMTMTHMDENGTPVQTIFCDRYWQVMSRVRTADGTWQLEIGYQQYGNRPHKTFMLDSAAVTASDLLRKEFSARELHLYGGPRAIAKAQQVIMSNQNILYSYEKETATYPTMGWVTEGNTMRGELTGEFVLGDTVFAPRQPPEKVLLSDTVDMSLRADFRTRGTSAGWSALVDQIYNRPGAEPYQFIIASAFGSPLVRLMPGDGDWHGIPIVVGGNSGAAKTSTALVAMSLYAPGQVLRFSASNEQGDTVNALSIKVGSLRNLPCIMDEMTNLDATKVSNIMYMLANGKSRDRMGPNGRMIPNPYRWDAITYATSNESLHEVLTGLRNKDAQEAGQLRSFEIFLQSADLATIFKGVNRTMVEDDLLSQNYGAVGRDWIQFVVNNRLKISELLGAERKRYMVDPSDSSNIRFYKDLIITTKVAATLAKAKGFIRWDITAMLKWAEDQLITLRDAVQFKDWDGTISDFVGSLHGRTIVSKYLKLGPGRRSSNPELPLEPISTSAVPVARKAIDDKRFVITANVMKEWCHAHRVMPNTMLAEMHKRGFLAVGSSGKIETKLINIGSGTTVTRPQAPCYELDYDKVQFHTSHEEDADMTNVVKLKPAPMEEKRAPSQGAQVTS
jgi:Domain of unknown function (DUF927)